MDTRIALLVTMLIFSACAGSLIVDPTPPEGEEAPLPIGEESYQMLELSTPKLPFNPAEWNVTEDPKLQKGNGILIQQYGDISVEYVYDADGTLKERLISLPSECYTFNIPRNLVVRTQEEYETLLSSVYGAQYREFRQNRESDEKTGGLQYAETYADYSYEEFFRICNRFPQIDFSQYTLLGTPTQGSGCNGEDEFIRQVYRDDAAKTLAYTITEDTPAPGQMDCQAIVFSDNLILVQKIPEDYQVVFKAS